MLIYFLLERDFDKLLIKQQEQLNYDYPEIVSKLLLLYNAGLTIQNAFTAILNDAVKNGYQTNYVYQEIELTVNQLKNGASEHGAYTAFGQRCHVLSYIKLGTLLEQNIRKGSADLQDALQLEVREAFNAHKTNCLQSGEKNGTKMLIPMILILAVIMMIVVAPAFLSMNVS